MKYERTHWQQTAVRESKTHPDEFIDPFPNFGEAVLLVMIMITALALIADAYGVDAVKILFR